MQNIKKITAVFAVLLVAMLALTSCNKDITSSSNITYSLFNFSGVDSDLRSNVEAITQATIDKYKVTIEGQTIKSDEALTKIAVNLHSNLKYYLTTSEIQTLVARNAYLEVYVGGKNNKVIQQFSSLLK